VAINELSINSGIFALGESILIAVIACAIALKITEFISGNSDNRIIFGFVLLVFNAIFNILLLFGFFSLSPLSLGIVGYDLVEYLASYAYREFMVTCTVIIQSIFTLGLTFSKNY
jgi:hypothetical protein